MEHSGTVEAVRQKGPTRMVHEQYGSALAR